MLVHGASALHLLPGKGRNSQSLRNVPPGCRGQADGGGVESNPLTYI